MSVWRTFQSRQSCRKPVETSRRKSRFRDCCRRCKLMPSSSRRSTTLSRTRLVYSARDSIPSTCERKVLQQEQRARYSPTVSSMMTISPKAISRTGRVCVSLRLPCLPHCGQGNVFGAQDCLTMRMRGSTASMPVSFLVWFGDLHEGTGWFFWQDQLKQRLKSVAFSEKCLIIPMNHNETPVANLQICWRGVVN